MEPLDLIKAKRQHIGRLANQRGAAGELEAIASMAGWVPRPRGSGLKVLLAALRASGVIIRQSAFDAVALTAQAKGIDFCDQAMVQAMLADMIFIEIKTASQKRVKADFSGYFFALTEGEIEAAEALGARHRVALFNKHTGAILMTSVPDIISRAKSMNWQLSVQL